MDTPRLKICLACSHGGHLTEMLQLRDAFEGHDAFYFCYDAATTRRLDRAYLVPNMARNPIEMAKNFVRLFRIFRKERPDLIVSTGAEIAIPVVFVGKLFGVPTVYIECGAQVTQPSFTGRIMARIANQFYVQWPELLPAYRSRAQLRGSFIDSVAPFTNDRAHEQRAVVALVLEDGVDLNSAALLASALQRGGVVARVVDARRTGSDRAIAERLLEVMAPDLIVELGGDHPPQYRGVFIKLSDASRLRVVFNAIAEKLDLDLDADTCLAEDGLFPDWPIFPASARSAAP